MAEGRGFAFCPDFGHSGPRERLRRSMGAGSDHLAGYSQIEGVMSSALPKRNGPIEEEPVPRPATTQDLASFVAIQLAAFPGSLTTQLGARFLAAYYSGIVDAESAIALIAEHDGEAVGIAVGFINPSVFYESLRHRKRRLALAMIPGLARRPWLVGAVVRNYFWAGTSSHGGRDIAELASIAVLPQASGMGREAARGVCCRSRRGRRDSYRANDRCQRKRSSAWFLRKLWIPKRWLKCRSHEAHDPILAGFEEGPTKLRMIANGKTLVASLVPSGRRWVEGGRRTFVMISRRLCQMKG